MNSMPMLAADPALPQRDVLLDETVMAGYLSRLIARYGEFGIEECERLRTKYRFGTSLRALYKIRGNGRTYRIAARAFPRTQRVGNQSIAPAEVHAAELNTIFWIFPHDRKIKNLSVLNDIPDELSDINGHKWIKSRIAAHAPEKSLTVRCIGENEETLAYAKIYAGDEGRQIFHTYNEVANALQDSDQLEIPRALAYSEEYHVLLLESVSGTALSLVPSTQRENSYFRLGQALKTLHQVAPPSSTSHNTRLTPSALTRTAAIISQARPDVASLAQRLTDRLVSSYNQHREGAPVLLHGDVHPKNILLDNERLWLLDLDQAAVGVAVVDLGGVLAGLYSDFCVGSLTRHELTSLKRAFLAGYGTSGSLQALRWHVAAALVQERALRAITRIRPGSLQKLSSILMAAEAVLNGGISEN